MTINDNQKKYMDQESIHGPDNYNPLPVVLSEAKGVWVWDVDQNKYLDMMSAYSAVSHGHAHPELVKVFHDQSETLSLTSRAFYTNTLGPYLETITKMSGFEMALPMNSGAEAVETAIKSARRWGYRSKNIEANKAEIIVADGNFHGRTTTIISFSSDSNSKDDFGPHTPGFISVEFGSSQAVADAINENTVAVLFEPIQGEGGIIEPPKNWLHDVRKLCDENNVLMILDEVQSGLGRTGKLFAYEHTNIKPDGLILGKALGGGFMPVSVFLSSKEVLQWINPGSHGSTFGGNPLGSAIAKRSLELLEEEGLIENSRIMGEYFKKSLLELNSSVIKEVRGKGLWLGVEIDPEFISGKDLSKLLLKKGILCKETRETTIRFAPPLIIKKDQIDWAVEIIGNTFKDLEDKA
ncbi:MAG: ornithine--oxo-acid transaminase [Gammaproteobacteria bacterium]|jgi:ornithine--oxo-acid transaminase|nr:ornithine--oxo-acid transaminase [Gammaproteobacteria bacterium]MDP6146773.1 ornithine--oxo-acid transaminase [Gammaproteobacteria bacterium]HJL79998.1 ornithine--oxo-acid transaminase [Gammaproteobacteria bacterium]HJM09018.1 ornithine--oxo-acid transaminase [Gammaproteobacteria bacterium]HJN01362.1 ornithine--oxo-acid transaminase [Gammaproteobacteria bacterium]|tara:strand:+ start:3682 stop:4908 length:1227 start_codon:yes stop_codon:yes gene_type:complete